MTPREAVATLRVYTDATAHQDTREALEVLERLALIGDRTPEVEALKEAADSLCFTLNRFRQAVCIDHIRGTERQIGILTRRENALAAVVEAFGNRAAALATKEQTIGDRASTWLEARQLLLAALNPEGS